MAIAEAIDKCTRLGVRKLLHFELGHGTRGGIRHGFVVEDEFLKHGIELISTTEMIPEGPIGDLIKAVRHFGNQQQAYNISKSVARSLEQSLSRNARPAANRTPFGFDRQYVGPDGIPRIQIRWEGLTQLRLDPNTLAVIGRSEREPLRKPPKNGEKQEKRRPFFGYKKQRDEISRLVIGSDEAVRSVHTIFKLYYLEDWGLFKITHYMRSHDYLTPSGGGWNIASVRQIINNPIYVGLEVRHRWSRAVYNKLGVNGPIPVTVDQDKLKREGRKQIPMVERPRDEWVTVERPEFRDFLPAELRTQAREHILKLIDKEAVVAKQAARAKRKNKADENDHVLSRIVRSKANGHMMRGEWRPRKRNKAGIKNWFRCYFDYNAHNQAFKGVPARRVLAEPFEEAIVPAVMSVFTDKKWIEERVRAAVEAMRLPMADLDDRRKTLEAERCSLTRRLARIYQASEELAEEELKDLVRDDNARILAIRSELALMERTSKERPPTVDEAVASVLARLKTLPKDWRSVPKRDLKRFLGAVIEKLEVDLETFEVDLSIRLPGKVLKAVDPALVSAGNFNFTSAWLPATDTPHAGAINIADFRCSRYMKFREQCFVCHRSSRQAAWIN